MMTNRDIFASVVVESFHRINNFFGSDLGSVVKFGFELAILTLATYMILSEFMRSHEKKLRYLAMGFGLFALGKLMGAIATSFLVFTSIPLNNFIFGLYFIYHTLEILAFSLICFYFILPFFEKYYPDQIKKVKWVPFFFIVPLAADGWIWITAMHDLRMSFMWTIITEFVFLMGILSVMTWRYADFKALDRYHRSFCHALSCFLIPPFLLLINIFFFESKNPGLIIISHPFPFISVLLIIRVVYLRLADKALLIEELDKAEKKYVHAKEINELKDEFVGVISHELRTPITSMKLYLSLLKKEKLGPLQKEQADALDTMSEECDRLTNLISDVLDLAKLEGKKMKLSLVRIDLAKIVEKSRLLPIAEKKSLNVINDIPKNMYMMADSVKLQQVFVNLIANAIKFTNENGLITISAKKGKRSISIKVKDTGIGIAKEHIPQLFNKFYQVQNHLTREVGGTGLGLAIVKQIVELHNGRIWVESQIGEGTTIFIELPVHAMGDRTITNSK